MLYLWKEFVRAIFSRRFAISLLIGLGLLFIALTESYSLDPTPPPLEKFLESFDEELPPGAENLNPIPPLKEWDYAYYNAYEAWLRSVDWGFFPIFALLGATLPYADTLVQERTQKFARYVLLRTRHRRYLLTKFFVNGLVGGFAIALPLALFFSFTSWKYARTLPPLSGTLLDSWLSCNIGTFLCDLYRSSPDQYIFWRILLAFIYGTVFATLGMSFSAFTSNRYVVLFSPFFFELMLAYGLNFLGTPVFVPRYALAPTGILGTNALTIFSPLVLIFGASLSMAALYIRKYKNAPY